VVSQEPFTNTLIFALIPKCLYETIGVGFVAGVFMKAQVWKLLGLILTLIFVLSTAHPAYGFGVIDRITVGNRPVSIAYDFGKGEIFVANNYNNSVSVISNSTNTVVATIPVGNYPEGLAYDSAKGEIFVANSAVNLVTHYISNTVTVISDAAILTTPTPTVPELSWLVVIPLLVGILSAAVVLRHRKSASLSK
jgi:YVTN family beta-propeller protein